jgi:hypothetical protein
MYTDYVHLATMTIPASQRQYIWALHKYTKLSGRQISRALDIPWSTIQNIIDRGPTPDPDYESQHPFAPVTSQRIYEFFRHSPTSRHKS